MGRRTLAGASHGSGGSLLGHVVQSYAFGLGNEVGERLLSPLTLAVPVGQEVQEPDSAVAAGLLERDLAVLEKPHQSGAANAEQIGSFLRR